ncbi:beta strand repeat-containing protein [Zavarzinia aquatilis]|nr:DUF11 domain-containing protein [Zavarzinia aquatilis]
MKRGRGSSRLLGLWLLAMAAVIGTGGAALAAAPAAGTIITNSASATYLDALGASQTAQSNTVETKVLPKAAFTLTQDNTKQGAPGTTVYFPHILTNTGNAADSFTLTLSAITGTAATSCEVYLDNGSGQPTGASLGSCGSAFTTSTLAAGADLKLVIAVPVGASATPTDTASLTITGASVADGTLTPIVNTDTLQVTNGAAFSIVKAISGASSGPAGSTISYTLTINNTGNAAGDVTITDTFGTANAPTSGLLYLPGSGRWSSSGSTAMSDASDGNDQTAGAQSIDYSFATTGTSATDSGSAGKLTVVLHAVAPNSTQQVTFQVKVSTVAVAGVVNAPVVGRSQTTNQATYSCPTATNASQTCTTTQVPYDVTLATGVVINGSTSSSANGTGEPVNIPSAAAGQTVSYTNVVWNTGNSTDTFKLTQTSTDFPAGTTFLLYQADGATPLTNTTTPPIPALDTDASCVAPLLKDTVLHRCGYPVVVKATLPTSAPAGGPFTTVYTATSNNDPTKSDTVADTLTILTAAQVTLANDAALALKGASAPQTTLTASAGSSVTFPLYIASNIADTYTLTASQDNFSGTLPSGWSVVFRTPTAGSCSAPGTVDNTVTINAAQTSTTTGTLVSCAVVTTSASAAPGTQPVYFKVVGTSTAVSIKQDAVTIATARSITLTPNNSGQAVPGGSVTYAHVLTNTGNAAEGGTCSTVVFSGGDSLSGWSSVIYYDKNNDGTLDSGDPVVNSVSEIAAGGLYTDGTAVTAQTLPVGKAVRLFVKVFAPASAIAGQTDTRTLTATVSNSSCTAAVPAAQTVTDVTNVNTALVRLEKTQALDAGCDGTADGAFGAAQIEAKPGQCVVYRVVATNQGTQQVTALKINDSTPSYTTYSGPTVATLCSPSGSADSAPSVGGSGAIACGEYTLAAGASVTLQFRVKINE